MKKSQSKLRAPLFETGLKHMEKYGSHVCAGCRDEVCQLSAEENQSLQKLLRRAVQGREQDFVQINHKGDAIFLVSSNVAPSARNFRRSHKRIAKMREIEFGGDEDAIFESLMASVVSRREESLWKQVAQDKIISHYHFLIKTFSL